MPGRSITDAIFIVHQLQETTHAINKTLNTAFVDPGVSSGAAHTEHAWNCKKQSPCWLQPEWRVQCESGCSPRILPETLLLVVVLEALSQDFPTECPWENLYADDLVIISESLEESQEKLILKKTNMGWKGLWVNMDKTKVLISGPGIDVLQKSEKNPVLYVSRASTQTSFSVLVVPVGSAREAGVYLVLWSKPDPSVKCKRCTGQARP